MNKVFFIADPHFGHKNIIDYENRPFKDINEMDKHIIDNWNNTVDKDDTVFLLGDIAFYNNSKTAEICHMLNGKKTLVMGNHDTDTVDFYYNICGFENVSKYPIIYNEFWILSHSPIYLNRNMPYANIFGHIHNNAIYSNYSKQSFCVSVERINYTPIEFSKIKTIMGVES